MLAAVRELPSMEERNYEFNPEQGQEHMLKIWSRMTVI